MKTLIIKLAVVSSIDSTKVGLSFTNAGLEGLYWNMPLAWFHRAVGDVVGDIKAVDLRMLKGQTITCESFVIRKAGSKLDDGTVLKSDKLDLVGSKGQTFLQLSDDLIFDWAAKTAAIRANSPTICTKAEADEFYGLAKENKARKLIIDDIDDEEIEMPKSKKAPKVLVDEA
jgi:hypothetical protein